MERNDSIFVVAPIGRDADLICRQMRTNGIVCEKADSIEEVCDHIMHDEVAALVMTEEALGPGSMALLAKTLADQPAWSEIPLLILTGVPALEHRSHSFAALGRRTNVTLVDRPVRIKSLASALRAALRARKRQYEVRDLMRQLEERIHERDRFLAVLGHELRNPLGAIMLASQMSDADGHLDQEHVRVIERQSRHLTRLVNDLLDLSRVAAGKIVLKKQHLDLRDMARQSMSVAQPLADKAHVELRTVFPGHPLVVEADPVRIEQIITNLVTNAVKYTPEGGHVTLQLASEDGEAIIRVTDDGVGIDPDRIGRIFELFAQAENAIGRAQGGMGIGLALVRNLVQLHNGTVCAKSDGVGKGSEFCARLPLAKTQSVIAAKPEIPLQNDIPMPLRRIVVVEDNPDIRDLLRLKLRRLGHDVADARDGIEGLDVILREKPDLALVDLGLPGMDGYDVAKGIRRELGKDVVLVAVSGFGQPDDKRRAIEAGFDDHITKPADVNDIENVLKRFPPRA
ncbi:MAG TPA: hybrid sensor histidine kinase/response regulator [Thermoanaerobaculia bacterium]|nr:hybrid sensor histidine kinase/response regulator [Thermoanaerobaculia bacterium]